MARTLISLGANLGNVLETMNLAKEKLREEFPSCKLEFSRLYRTPPVGGPEGQGDFLNGIVALESNHDVWRIWEGIKRIEANLGRYRMQRWEARRIDIDILLHEDLRIWTPHFKVPHPRMCMRSFLLVPALEVAPSWIEPVSGWSIERLAKNVNSPYPIRVVTTEPGIEESLKKEIALSAEQPDLVWDYLPASEFNPRKVRGSGVSPEAAVATPGETPRPRTNYTEHRLLILAVATEEPGNLPWEEGARGWAERLGMATPSPTQTAQPTVLPSLAKPSRSGERLQLLGNGPRYLLPANDIPWASHEILAAHEALSCHIEPIS